MPLAGPCLPSRHTLRRNRTAWRAPPNGLRPTQKRRQKPEPATTTDAFRPARFSTGSMPDSALWPRRDSRAHHQSVNPFDNLVPCARKVFKRFPVSLARDESLPFGLRQVSSCASTGESDQGLEFKVPHTERPIGARGNQTFAVWVKNEVLQNAHMAVERDWGPFQHTLIPNENASVVSGCRQQKTIGVDGDLSNRSLG